MWNMSLIFTSFVLQNTPELIEQTRKFVMIVKKNKNAVSNYERIKYD